MPGETLVNHWCGFAKPFFGDFFSLFSFLDVFFSILFFFFFLVHFRHFPPSFPPFFLLCFPLWIPKRIIWYSRCCLRFPTEIQRNKISRSIDVSSVRPWVGPWVGPWVSRWDGRWVGRLVDECRPLGPWKFLCLAQPLFYQYEKMAYIGLSGEDCLCVILSLRDKKKRILKFNPKYKSKLSYESYSACNSTRKHFSYTTY